MRKPIKDMDPKWTLYLGVILLAAAFVPAAGSHKHYDEPCPQGWNDNGYICWKELNEKENFKGALQGCIRKSKLDEFHAELMPVRFLRELKNPNHYHDNVDRRHNHHVRGVYRVNGLLDKERMWVNIPSGKEVKFSHYDKPATKKPGYTLVWDTFSNELRREDRYDHHKVLCYTKRKHDCRKCHRSHQQDECSTNGNCYKGTCFCDEGFKGEYCSMPTTDSNDKELFVFGGTDTSIDEKYNFKDGSFCKSKSTFPFTQEYFAGYEFVFGDIWACGGLKDQKFGQKTCFKFNQYKQHWKQQENLSLILAEGGSAALRSKSREEDKLWWITFGNSYPNSSASATEDAYAVGSTIVKTWYDQEGFRIPEGSPKLPKKYGRRHHCVVQISDCEMAVIGGVTDESDGHEDWILIYNFEDNTWKRGPNLLDPTMRINPSCGTIRDPITNHLNVIIACGNGQTDDPEPTEYWDLETWEVRVMEDQPCPATNMEFDGDPSLNEWEFVMTNGQPNNDVSGSIHTFNIEEGFQTLESWPLDGPARIGGGVVIIPPDLVLCETPNTP